MHLLGTTRIFRRNEFRIGPINTSNSADETQRRFGTLVSSYRGGTWKLSHEKEASIRAHASGRTSRLLLRSRPMWDEQEAHSINALWNRDRPEPNRSERLGKEGNSSRLLWPNNQALGKGGKRGRCSRGSRYAFRQAAGSSRLTCQGDRPQRSVDAAVA